MKNFLQLVAIAAVLVLGLGAGHLYRQLFASTAVTVEMAPVDMTKIGLVDEQRPIMISLSTCPVCKEAREWLSTNHIDHVELVIDQSEDAGRIARELNLSAVPAFLFNGQQMTGFNPKRLRELLNSRS